MKISNTQVSMWQRCPRQWEFRYIKGIKIPPKGVMVQGSAYHGALKANFEHKINKGEDLKIDSVLDAFDTYWNERLGGKYGDKDEEEEIEKSNVDWEDNKPEVLKDEGYRLVKLYHKGVAPEILPLSVEQEASKTIGDFVFHGFIDLDTSQGIIDHKLKSRSMNEEEANRDSQPFSYLFLKDKDTFYFHAAIKKRLPEIQIVKVQKSAKDIEWWLEAIKGIVKQMKTGIAPPRWNDWSCSERWCGYWRLCRG